MKKAKLMILIAAGTIGFTFGTGWAAGQIAPEKEIALEGPRPVHFKHKPHTELGITCGKCHHNADHKPLSAETIGELADRTRLKCTACHNEGFRNEELRTKKNIFHKRCRDCHQKGIEGKKGPMACGSCHVRKHKRTRTIEGC